MPNRIIKESIQTSDTLAAISADAERLFWRLVTAADDYGRYDARPHIVLGKCLAAFVGRVSADAVSTWLDELEHAGLIRRYSVGGKPLLSLTTWDNHQRPPRAKASKYPSPEEADTACGQMPAVQEPPPTPDGNCRHMTADAGTCTHMTADAPVFVFENRESRNEKTPPISPPCQGGTWPSDSQKRESSAKPPTPKPDPRVIKSDEDDLIAFDGAYFAVGKRQIEQWRESFPAVDVLGEIRKAHAWVDADPRRKKTRWKRFLVGWLSRAQDRARLPSGAGPPKTNFERVRELFQPMERVEDSGW